MNKKVLLLCSIFSFLKISQAEVKLPEYSDDSGLTCKAIVITDDFLKIADKVICDEDKAVYQEDLRAVLRLIDSSEIEIDPTKKADILEKAAEEVNSLMGLFEIEDNQLLEDIYLNVQMRAALMGNPTAIYEILDIPFPVRSESISKNFIFKGAPMEVEKFFMISEKINGKHKECSKENPLHEVLAEL